MTPDEYQQIIEEFDSLVRDTRALMLRFEASGMDETHEAEYLEVHAIFAKAVADQRAYTLLMLDEVA
ncbi:hypothetical protein [Halomonas salipaludis]|uniref:Uncharacterized protein n=1 Tax=Halomonas salipaludis TaxID=2032625 RepID=A0A2A2EQL2_9GAMM|nr:hypothetical protein [Halomonas salipaludis]PAU74689.1 hypothetical protein CK498_21445 [Halomonas salipaludis]